MEGICWNFDKLTFYKTYFKNNPCQKLIPKMNRDLSVNPDGAKI